MSVFNFEADLLIHHGGIDMKLVADAVGQRLRVARFEQNHVAADLAGQCLGRAQRYEIAFIQDRQPVATFGFFHQVRGDDDGDMLLIAEDLEILPKVAPGAGIETGGGLVEKQNFRMMEQAFGELDAALHAAGESFYAIAGAVEQSDAGKNLVDAGFEFGPAQAVKVSLMPEILVGGELGIDALRLEDNADVAAQRSGLANRVEAGNRGAAEVGTMSVERMRKRVVLPLPLGPSSPKSSAGRTSKETPLSAVRS